MSETSNLKKKFKLFFFSELDVARVGEEDEAGRRVMAEREGGGSDAQRVKPTIPSWKGDQLFPPGKTRKKLSKAWQYWGF